MVTGVDRAAVCLRIGLVLQCVAAAYVAGVHYSEVNSYLLMTLGQPESMARGVDRLAAGLLLAVALSAAVRPLRPLLLFAALWMALVAFATYAEQGSPFARFAPCAQAVRYVAPLVLVLWSGARRSDASRAARFGKRLLVAAVALTFGAHGVEALLHQPPFVDLTIAAARNVAGWRLDQDGAELALTWIGVHDLLLAAGVLLGRWRWLAGYMAFWGLLTALSRVLHSGFGSWYLTLLRAENFMAPLALWFLRSPEPSTDRQ